MPRKLTAVASIRPSSAISCRTRRDGPLITRRTDCDAVDTHLMVVSAPKHTSSPFGVHASPESDDCSGIRLRLARVLTSTSAGHPRSSSCTGCSWNAIRSPAGEKRGEDSHPAVSYRTVPAGNSRRVRPPSEPPPAVPRRLRSGTTPGGATPAAPRRWSGSTSRCRRRPPVRSQHRAPTASVHQGSFPGSGGQCDRGLAVQRCR